MATVTEEPAPAPPAAGSPDLSSPPAQRFLLDAVSWDEYESLLRGLGDRPIRVTYDRGKVELMSPSIGHEEVGRLLGRVVETVAEELDIPCLALKSATWRRRLADRGLEADECFYLANAERVVARGKRVDLEVDPPPDLCIEVEITRSALDRLEIYGALGVPEVWRHDGESLRVVARNPDGTYEPRDRSPSLPFLPLDEVARLIASAEGMDHSRWGRIVRAWVRETVLPLYEAARREEP